MNTTLTIRRSQPNECDELIAMQRASMRELGAACYDASAIEAFIAHVGTLDASLIDDGTFFSARIGRVLVASGGWTSRMPNDTSHMPGSPDQRPDVTIRSIFVHPAWTRHGFARRLMAVIEDDIAAAGYDTAALKATLTGIPFYRQLGYRGQEPAVLRLPGDIVFFGLHMHKRLAEQRATLAHAAWAGLPSLPGPCSQPVPGNDRIDAAAIC